MQKYYFYETMKNDVFLYFCASTVNIFTGFLCSVKIIHMGAGFYYAMMRIFILFSMQMMKVNMQCKKINMDNYQVTSRRGFIIFKPTELDFSTIYSLSAPSDPEDGSPDD
jgi:hypothetical protein